LYAELILAFNLTACSVDMIKIIMDVDTGIDDAIAMIMALQSPEIEILAISTVSGNVSARLAGLNTLGLLKMFDKHLVIPVIQGAARPLSKKIMRAEEDIHGQKGIGNVKLNYNQLRLQLRKGEKISHRISRILDNYKKKEVSFVATGPLTNIAFAITEDPAFVNHFSRICIMGGAYGLASKVYGNITEYAEFNFYYDPIAAQIVMSSPAARLNIVGLDATDRYLVVNEKFMVRLDDQKSKASKLAKSILEYPLRKFGRFNLPDTFAVGMLEKPNLFQFVRGRVVVTSQGGELWGHSKFIQRNNTNQYVVKKVDQKGFSDYVFSRLGNAKITN
jgi:inosine-uridine nucleoside N-ribohydrolase